MKVAPWGRRRLAYAIDRHREGAYHIVVFESPAEAIAELERSLQITEEVLRYLVTRSEKPIKARRDAAAADGSEEGEESEDEDDVTADLVADVDDEDADDAADEARIDESESEAAPAAID